jgi:hypothetical protein
LIISQRLVISRFRSMKRRDAVAVAYIRIKKSQKRKRSEDLKLRLRYFNK